METIIINESQKKTNKKIDQNLKKVLTKSGSFIIIKTTKQKRKTKKEL